MARYETIGAIKLRQHVDIAFDAKLKCHVRDVFSVNFTPQNEIPVPDGLNDHILESIETIDRRVQLSCGGNDPNSLASAHLALRLHWDWVLDPSVVARPRQAKESPNWFTKGNSRARCYRFHCLIVRKFLSAEGSSSIW